MSATLVNQDWAAANQQLLVAEFARLKGRLRGDADAAAGEDVARCRAALASPAAIDVVVERFACTAFERDLLLLAAGVEMDAEVAALCASAAGDPRARWASFALALATLADPHWSALTPTRPLRRWRLLEPAEDAPLVSARLRIDERVLHYLAGINYLDPRLQPMLRRVYAPPRMATAQRRVAEDIAGVLADAPAPLPALQLWGNDPHGMCDVAAAVAALCGFQLHAMAAGDVPGSAAECEALATLWEREAAFLDSGLLLEAEGEVGMATQRFVERVGGVVFLAGREPRALSRPELRHRVDKPDRADQMGLWQHTLGDAAPRLNGAVDGLATQFRLSARDIARAGDEATRDAAFARDPERALWEVCCRRERNRFAGVAQRIESAAGWDDLVLPDGQKAALRQIAAHFRHRSTVYERWGFAQKSARGLGISGLFAGESGTGKTMAAEVLANDLRLEIFRIDLAALVSKYIGETEKNLARVFEAAEDSGAILLFDEADALFGKRSEVKDSHDRYANIEVSYLLQRMETYRGLAILTTNQRAALDPAFQRRLRFVIQFPFPDAGEREAIWRRVFPATTPTADLDFAKLARLHMAGGHIKNIAVNAAFFAADAGQPVTMAHLLRAAHGEAQKRERPLTEIETRGWA